MDAADTGDTARDLDAWQECSQAYPNYELDCTQAASKKAYRSIWQVEGIAGIVWSEVCDAVLGPDVKVADDRSRDPSATDQHLFVPANTIHQRLVVAQELAQTLYAFCVSRTHGTDASSATAAVAAMLRHHSSTTAPAVAECPRPRPWNGDMLYVVRVGHILADRLYLAACELASPSDHRQNKDKDKDMAKYRINLATSADAFAPLLDDPYLPSRCRHAEWKHALQRTYNVALDLLKDVPAVAVQQTARTMGAVLVLCVPEPDAPTDLRGLPRLADMYADVFHETVETGETAETAAGRTVRRWVARQAVRAALEPVGRVANLLDGVAAWFGPLEPPDTPEPRPETVVGIVLGLAFDVFMVSLVVIVALAPVRAVSICCEHYGVKRPAVYHILSVLNFGTASVVVVYFALQKLVHRRRQT